MTKGQTLISFFLNYCEQYKSQLILEGVECEEEVAAAIALGVSIAQGYAIGLFSFGRLPISLKKNPSFN